MRRTWELLLHFFTPRHTNNHRAKALHLGSITTYITLLLVFQIFLTGVSRFAPGVLGYASNIKVSDLLRITNEKRAANGAGPVTLDSQLSSAAEAKGENMFAEQYWAHTSPSGKDPWLFIVASGYNYLFAGENLARDFGDSVSVVQAWMDSPSHRENLMNRRYEDVGFAVVNGKYSGYETTVVVQMFGTKPGRAPSVGPEETSYKPPTLPLGGPETTPPKEEVKVSSGGSILNVTMTPPPKPTVQDNQVIIGQVRKLSVVNLTKWVSIGLVLMLTGVLAIDGLIVSRRKIVRLSGHNLAHMIFLFAVLITISILGPGTVL